MYFVHNHVQDESNNFCNLRTVRDHTLQRYDTDIVPIISECWMNTQ